MKDSNQKRLSQKKLELNLIRTKGRTLSNSIINTNNNNNNQFYVSLAQEMKTLVSANPKRNSNTHHLNQKLYLHSKVQTSKKKSKQQQKIKTKNKNLNEIIKTIYKNFNKKYSIDPNYYNIKVINEIVLKLDQFTILNGIIVINIDIKLKNIRDLSPQIPIAFMKFSQPYKIIYLFYF